MPRHALVRLEDLDRLEGLSERYRQLMLRLEAEAEAVAQYDRPPLLLQQLQAEAVRLRREAAALLERMLSDLTKPT